MVLLEQEIGNISLAVSLMVFMSISLMIHMSDTRSNLSEGGSSVAKKEWVTDFHLSWVKNNFPYSDRNNYK